MSVPPDHHCVPFSIKRNGLSARYVRSLQRLQYHVHSTTQVFVPSRGACPVRLNFFCTRVLIHHGLYVKILAHIQERNNTTSTIITTLRPVYFWTYRLKRSIFSLIRSQAARNISLESSHHPTDTGQEMESVGHVVPKLFHSK